LEGRHVELDGVVAYDVATCFDVRLEELYAFLDRGQQEAVRVVEDPRDAGLGVLDDQDVNLVEVIEEAIRLTVEQQCP
jgi:hypothetical protein